MEQDYLWVKEGEVVCSERKSTSLLVIRSAVDTTRDTVRRGPIVEDTLVAGRAIQSFEDRCLVNACGKLYSATQPKGCLHKAEARGYWHEERKRSGGEVASIVGDCKNRRLNLGHHQTGPVIIGGDPSEEEKLKFENEAQ
eukprot:Gb_30030 [translate_table: standard]